MVFEIYLVNHLITLCQKLDYDQGELESSEETAMFLVMPSNFRSKVDGSENMAVNFGCWEEDDTSVLIKKR
jgi:hypothetical protein